MRRNNILKSSFIIYKKDFLSYLFLSISFLVISSLALCFGLLSPLLNLLSVLFIILPFYTGIVVTSSARFHNQQISNSYILTGFCRYFKEYRGVYSVIWNLIKSILIGLIFFFIFSFIYLQIAGNINPSMIEEINSMSKKFPSMSLEEIYNYLLNNIFIYNFLVISLLSSLAVGNLVFIISIGSKSMNIFVRSFLSPLPGSLVNMYYKSGVRNIRKKYYKDLFASSFDVLLLFIVGFSLGAYLTSLFSKNLSFLIAFSLIGGFGLMSLAIPRFAISSELMANKYMKDILLASISQTERLIERFSSPNLNAPQNIEALNKILDGLHSRIRLIEEINKEFVKEEEKV